jgi:hypothetical protein
VTSLMDYVKCLRACGFEVIEEIGGGVLRTDVPVLQELIVRAIEPFLVETTNIGYQVRR